MPSHQPIAESSLPARIWLTAASRGRYLVLTHHAPESASPKSIWFTVDEAEYAANLLRSALILDHRHSPEAAQALQSPCDVPCPKCRGSEINRIHRFAGDEWRYYGMERERESEFVAANYGWLKAKKECITHHCRVCQFDWETPAAS